jgi:hypothetical protein
VTADPVSRRFLAALTDRDWAGIGECFAPDASFRALTPTRLRTMNGPDEAAARYEAWFDDLDGFEVLAADADVIADRTRLRYRVRGRHPEHGWWVNEHTAYGRVADGLITHLSLTCSGFRPAAEPGG